MRLLGRAPHLRHAIHMEDPTEDTAHISSDLLTKRVYNRVYTEAFPTCLLIQIITVAMILVLLVKTRQSMVTSVKNGEVLVFSSYFFKENLAFNHYE